MVSNVSNKKKDKIMKNGFSKNNNNENENVVTEAPK
jgi:hypothetical protein